MSVKKRMTKPVIAKKKASAKKVTVKQRYERKVYLLQDPDTLSTIAYSNLKKAWEGIYKEKAPDNTKISDLWSYNKLYNELRDRDAVLIYDINDKRLVLTKAIIY